MGEVVDFVPIYLGAEQCHQCGKLLTRQNIHCLANPPYCDDCLWEIAKKEEQQGIY